MHYNIIYSDKTPFRYVKKKSKEFFSGKDFSAINGVFVHMYLDNVFKIDRNRIHIYVQNDVESQNLVNHYLNYVFNGNMIGIEQPVQTEDIALNSIKHVVI